MRTSLTKQQISDFEIEGIVKLPGIVNDNLLEKLNQCFDWSVANPGPIAVGKPTGEKMGRPVCSSDNAPSDTGCPSAESK